jgi:uncharacterized membrane protein YebE (DUF533 family)
MFDAEKLLGKIIGEVVGGGKSSMLNKVGAGSGLLTVIGLGVGAYEILKQQQDQKAPAAGMPPPPGPDWSRSAPPPPPPGMAQGGAPPPPPPMPETAPVASPLAGAPPSAGPAAQELSVRLIRIMVAAAHSDGTMDAAEERAVLDKMRGAELTQEEKLFLLNELHQPRGLEELTAGITDPSVAKTMYMLAVATISIDTERERAWLNELAGLLGISKEIQAFIEEQR